MRTAVNDDLSGDAFLSRRFEHGLIQGSRIHDGLELDEQICAAALAGMRTEQMPIRRTRRTQRPASICFLPKTEGVTVGSKSDRPAWSPEGAGRERQAYPYRRFADILADACARLGADAVRYSFIAVDSHHLLHDGLPAHPCETQKSPIFGHRFTLRELLPRQCSAI